MLSTALSQLLERARIRFGLEVEIFDGALQHVYPESGSDLKRFIGESPMVRRSLLDALAAGRPEHFDRGGISYKVYPLRSSTRLRQAVGLMAVRGIAQNGDSPALESWSEFARAIVEADFAAGEALSGERLYSRRLLANLRFLRHLVETDSEAELANAVVQAAAVWFDADARIYQQDLAGDYLLHTALPGAHTDDAAKRLNSLWVSSSSDVTRVGSIPEWGQPPVGSEVVLVPLSVRRGPDWVIALIGVVPGEAESTFPVLSRIVGVQLEAMRGRRMERTRERFETLLNQTGVRADVVPAYVVRELLDLTGATSAALTLNRRGRLRRLVSIGTIGAIVPKNGHHPPTRPDDWLFGPDQFVCEFGLAADASAALELRPAAGDSFTPEAALVTRVAARVLENWMRGAEPTLVDEPAAGTMPQSAAVSAFLRRIEEELERAKRFDLRLSLVLIDVPPQLPGENEAFVQVQETLRRELRGSDVLGKMNGQRVAALLTHTDAPGSYKVVGRVRQRLAETAVRLNLPGVTIGHAVFSADCRTAEALVSQAARDAEPVAAI